ncbi:Ferredoxin 3 fused to uncharacterized domain protein [Lachnospiraceae bacterium TWA4]|nr:Ferredoxin 3 fused to uncharacterized domain protein [Lachnospiraceae bacterium TWA4]
MIRKIVQINEDKCNGCGLCASACHEGAIEMVDGKARLIMDSYCDGLGDCLPACPADAIQIVEREADDYDDEAVKAHLERMKNATSGDVPISCLTNWPVQIKLAPVEAPHYNGELLIAADCTAFSYARIHQEFIDGHTTLIGCPKLDAVNYAEKLSQIFAKNDVKEITLLRMEVPCCGGMEHMVKTAIDLSGKEIPVKVVTFAIKGGIVSIK